MEKVILGRTGLSVSVAGLGCGGFSRLGLGTGKHFDNAVQVVKCALQNGIDFIDTAEVYGTESAVGEGIKGFDRNKIFISTKFLYNRTDSHELRTAQEFESVLDTSLKTLGTDYLDIYHIHGVSAADYDKTTAHFYPLMQKAKEKGKIRFCGITEVFSKDTAHEMLSKTVKSDLFDVVMVGYNILNQSAVAGLLPAFKKQNIGTLCMFAVRNAFSKPERLRELIEEAGTGSLDWLINEGYASSITEAAYRFCRYTEGMNVILTGTGSEAHLLENIKSINMKPLAQAAVDRLKRMFMGIDNISGQ